MPIRTLELDPKKGSSHADSNVRRIGLRLFSAVEQLPIISPHGQTDPAWFANYAPFEDAVSLLLWPDHYLLRMLMSVGVTLESLGTRPTDEVSAEWDRRVIWRRFAVTTRSFLRDAVAALWLDHVFARIFQLNVRLEPETADLYYDSINAALATALLQTSARSTTSFGIELLGDDRRRPRCSPSSIIGAITRKIRVERPHHYHLSGSDDVTDPERIDFSPRTCGSSDN